MNKIEQPFILLILSCEKYKNQSILQKRTWLRTCLPPDFKYYHIIGAPNMLTEYAFNDADQILYVKTKDDYVSIPNKMSAAFSAINKTFEFKYIFKTDDNQVLLKHNLFSLLSSLLVEERNSESTTPNPETKTQSQFHYGGKIVDIPSRQKSKHHLIHPELPDNLYLQKTQYCSGPFYFLSSPALQDLLKREKREKFDQEMFEDYAVGYYLGAEFKHEILGIDTDKYFKEMPIHNHF